MSALQAPGARRENGDVSSFEARETAKKFNLTGWQTPLQLIYRSCSQAAAEKEKEWNTYYLLLVWNSRSSYYSFGTSWHDSWGVVSREPERERINYDSLEQMDKRLYIYLPVAWWGLETYPQEK